MVEPATSVHSQGSGRQTGLTIEEPAEEHMMRCTHTLEVESFAFRTLENECLSSTCSLESKSEM